MRLITLLLALTACKEEPVDAPLLPLCPDGHALVGEACELVDHVRFRLLPDWSNAQETPDAWVVDAAVLEIDPEPDEDPGRQQIGPCELIELGTPLHRPVCGEVGAFELDSGDASFFWSWRGDGGTPCAGPALELMEWSVPGANAAPVDISSSGTGEAAAFDETLAKLPRLGVPDLPAWTPGQPFQMEWDAPYATPTTTIVIFERRGLFGQTSPRARCEAQGTSLEIPTEVVDALAPAVDPPEDTLGFSVFVDYRLQIPGDRMTELHTYEQGFGFIDD